MNILNSKTETVAIDALRPHPRNPRQGDIGAIHESINNNGFYGSVIAQKTTGHILAGNHRWQAAQQAGATKIPVTWVDVDDDHALRILLADNRTNDIASYNEEELASILEQLMQDTGTLAGTGYDGDALDELLDDLGREAAPAEEEPEAQVDRADELQEKWGTKRGQLWQTGPHRILCGDSSDPEVLDALIGKDKVGCVLTDPPYGMNLDVRYDTMHNGKGHRKTGDRFKPVAGDDEVFDASPWITYFDDVVEQFWWGADYYRSTIETNGSWLVWDKRYNEAGMNLDLVHGASFELCWSRQNHKRDILRYLWSGHHGMQQSDTKQRVHPTQKPVPLLIEILTRWAPKNCIVIDPFAGSGSHLLAAHKTNRIGYGVELDPAYIAVILERFSNLGFTPELVKEA